MENENPKVTLLLRTTMGSMGSQLPVGTSGKGSLNKDLQFREMTTADERAIANRTKDDMSMAEQVSIVLAQMADKMGEYDFTQLKLPDKLLRLSQMYMGDVLAALIVLRIESIGKDFDVQFTCQCARGKKGVKTKVDLSTAEVTGAKQEQDALWDFPLKKPRNFRGAEVKSLVMGPPRWSVIVDMANGINPRQAELTTMRHCVRGFNGEKATLFDMIDGEFDQISRLDLSRLSAEMDEHVIGPHMRMDLECPHCSKEHRIGIDWRYRNFFSVSSQSNQSTD